MFPCQAQECPYRVRSRHESRRRTTASVVRVPCGKAVWVYANATLRAAVRQIDHGRLPSHQAGQRSNFVEVYIRMVSQTALHGTASVIVLNAVSDERLDAAIVHLARHLNRHLALRSTHQTAQPIGQRKLICSLGKVKLGGFAGFHVQGLFHKSCYSCGTKIYASKLQRAHIKTALVKVYYTYLLKLRKVDSCPKRHPLRRPEIIRVRMLIGSFRPIRAGKLHY